MARTRLSRRTMPFLVAVGILVAGLLAQESRAARFGFADAAEEDRNYTEITMTADEAYLDLRVDVEGAAVRLRELLEARGEKFPEGLLPERWFQVGDAWIRLEPLPYMPGNWSRMRVRVGSFQTAAEQNLAADLLSELAFQLDLERGDLPREADEIVDEMAVGVDAEAFEASQSLEGGYRFAGARVTSPPVQAPVDDVAQQPLQLYVPVSFEMNNTGYADGYDDGYSDAFQRSRYRFYGGYASPYAYYSPWTFSCLSYNWWSYGFRFGWNNYSSYYAWCSPYSGWGWPPSGLWWGGAHALHCSCALCADSHHYADAHDHEDGHDCDESDDHDEEGDQGGGSDTPGDGQGEGGPLDHGDGLLARDLETGALPAAATPIAMNAPTGVVSWAPRAKGLDSTSGPAARGLADSPDESEAKASPSTATTSLNGDELAAGGSSGSALAGGAGAGDGSGVVGDVPPAGVGGASEEEQGGDEVVTQNPPERTLDRGRIGWTPTVRTVTARTVRVGSPGATGGVRPRVRTDVPTRSPTGFAGIRDSAVILRSSSSMPIAVGESSSKAPQIRVSTPSAISRSVSRISRESSPRTVTSHTAFGTSRSATPSVSRTSTTSTMIRPTSVIGTSSSRSLPVFNRQTPVPSRGTSVKSDRSSNRSSGAKRSSGKKRSSRPKSLPEPKSSSKASRSSKRSGSKRDR
jgi:hypothetical protein